MDKYATLAVCFLLVLSGVTECISLAYGTLTDGQIVHYGFDEGSGTVVYDSSGYGNNALLDGATWETGKYNTGIGLGVGYLQVDASLTVSTAFSMCLWFNTSSADTNVTVSFDDASVLQIWSGYVFFRLNGEGWEPVNIGYSANTWTFLAVTFNGATVKYYLDGVYDSSLNFAYDVTNLDGLVNIGADTGDTSLWSGVIDEFRIYNRLLGAGDVLALYQHNPLAAEEVVITELNWMAFIVLLAFAFLNVVLMLIPRFYVLNFAVGALTLAFAAATVNDSTLPIQPYFSLIVALLAVLGILRAANLLRSQ